MHQTSNYETYSTGTGTVVETTYERYSGYGNGQDYRQPLYSTHSDHYDTTSRNGYEVAKRSVPAPGSDSSPRSSKFKFGLVRRRRDNYDFNEENLLDLMVRENESLKGSQPVTVTITPIVDTTTVAVAPTVMKDSTYRIDYPALQEKHSYIANAPEEQIDESHTPTLGAEYHQVQVVEVEKKSHFYHSTQDTEKWHHKKYIDDEEYEETRLDFCGLCVSKRTKKIR